MKRLFILIILVFLAVPCSAEQIYVRANADLEEIVPTAPFVVTSEIKQKLSADAPIHPKFGVKYITKRIAKTILGCSGTEARQVINALVEDGTILTVGERYSELYPSEEPE